jgi:succinate dehydrogenase / fumarate reductase iron-sulfur subunit
VKITLHVWRQKNKSSQGALKKYPVSDVSPDSSFLEMLDQLNEELVEKGEEPIVFDHDCREGICGSCSMVINGRPHGPDKGTTSCQLHMRSFKDGDAIYVEPFRAKAFPVLKDLLVDRSAFDAIQQKGGYVSVATGNAPDANALPISKDIADSAFNTAACIGCGACVAACKNSSAMLFTAAKVAQLSMLPQGQPERKKRAVAMVEEMDSQGFGNCSNHLECEAACPKEISGDSIALLNKEYVSSVLTSKE